MLRLFWYVQNNSFISRLVFQVQELKVLVVAIGSTIAAVYIEVLLQNISLAAYN